MLMDTEGIWHVCLFFNSPIHMLCYLVFIACFTFFFGKNEWIILKTKIPLPFQNYLSFAFAVDQIEWRCSVASVLKDKRRWYHMCFLVQSLYHDRICLHLILCQLQIILSYLLIWSSCISPLLQKDTQGLGKLTIQFPLWTMHLINSLAIREGLSPNLMVIST